jgi:cobalt-zinc-cadmium efflux system outer membrane protein
MFNAGVGAARFCLKPFPHFPAFWVLSLWQCLSFSVAAAQPAAPVELTIEQAIDEALENNLGLLAERANLSIAEASTITAGLRPNPVLSFSTDSMNTKAINLGPPEIALRIDVPIETADKRQRRLEAAGYNRAIAEIQLLDAIRKVKLDVYQAGLNFLQAKAQLQLALSGLKLLEEFVDVNVSRVRAGSISVLELTRSRVAMLQFRSTVKRAELELATARTKLQNLLGRKLLSDKFEVVGALKEPLRIPSLDAPSLTELALTTRPDVKALERQVARSQAELKLQLALGKVDYTIGTEYRRQSFNHHNGANMVGLFFSVPIPLFSRNQGEIARVSAEQEQLRRQLEARKAEIAMEVRTAHEEFRSARALVESIENDVIALAEQARNGAAYAYRIGAATLIDFLDPQRAFNESMQSYLEAQVAYRRAMTQLNASVGQEVFP